MKSICLLIIFLCLSSLTDLIASDVSVKTKDTFVVVLYNTSMDFQKKKKMDIDAFVISDNTGDYHFYANKIIDKTTGKKVKDAGFIWAIEYNGGVYLNLAYMDQINYVGMFVKMDLVGTICAVRFDERLPIELIMENQGIATYGAVAGGSVGGFVGGALAGLAYHLLTKNKNGGSYPDKEGKSSLIVFCELDVISYRNFSYTRNESSLLYTLTKKELDRLKIKYLSYRVSRDPGYEEVINFFNIINQNT